MFAGTSSSASAWAIAIYSGTELKNSRNENLTPRLSEFDILFLGFFANIFHINCSLKKKENQRQ